MARKVFLSFHYKKDVLRVSQVKEMGALEEQPILDANGWEEVKRQGSDAIKRWINDKMRDKDCVIVLIGSETASRPWVKYEIEKAWRDGKGVMGIYIHNLKDPRIGTSAKGRNPFAGYTIPVNGKNVNWDSIVPVHDPKSWDAYKDIENKIESWIDNAIAVRKKY